MAKLYDAKFFSSRLLGKNRFFDDVGAVMDIELKDNVKVAQFYQQELERLLAVLPIKKYKLVSTVFANGINIAISYPYDLLMVACEILDWVWEDIVDYIDRGREINFERSKRRFKQIINENQQLILRKIYLKAQAKKLNFFVHKDLLVLGSGKTSFCTKLQQVTKLSDIPWKTIANIPTVLITGTNGKTTTTRLTEFICRKGAKLSAGYCSTDWVMINGKLIGEGDLSGPTGHQVVLMNPNIDVAILEVARGGIIKRGLLPNYTTAATITNIAHDHIGQNGIDSLDDLAKAKGVVYNGLAEDGLAIINLDDEHVAKLAIKQNKAYISQKLSEFEISKYLNADNYVVYLANEMITIKTASGKVIIDNIKKIPVTVDGLALYNYENIIQAAALAYALGITAPQIKRGLRLFGGDDRSNFGRWNHYISSQYGNLVVDIAHNPAGLNSVLNLATQYRQLHNLSGKLGLMYGVTGDRRESIPEIAQIIVDYQPDLVIIKEFQVALRGSVPGEMPELLRNALLDAGFPTSKLMVIPNELEALEFILTIATADDFFMLCSHELLNDVSKRLREIRQSEKQLAKIG